MPETHEDRAARFARDTEPLYEVLSRRARRLTRCDADADDLLQDTLLHAYAGFHTFTEGTNLKAWLFRILYNRWVSTYRNRQRHPTEVSLGELADLDLALGAARVTAGLRSAETEFMEALPDDEIKAAMDALPESFRKAVYYAAVEGYTLTETAALLDIPVGTVMSRVSRGRQRLRVALAHVDHDRNVAAA